MSNLRTTNEPVVTILFKNCNQYRVAFFQHLRSNLEQKGIELRLLVGGGLSEDKSKGDVANLDWAQVRPFRKLNLMGFTLLWQPGFDVARDSDLVITEQASKQIFNIALSLGQGRLQTKHAFWGHGRNFQGSVEGTSGEGLKRFLTRRAHWFFAYNETSAEAAVEAGMDADRVTKVMNSTDTTRLRDVRASLPASTRQDVRQELGIEDGPTALYLGGIYAHKRPQFLVDAAVEIRRLIPNFSMVVIGSGSAAKTIEDASATYSWFHHVGARYGDDRVRLASVADLQLMPGLVGLNIVDGFALGLPTATTNIDYHSPEIEYLVDDYNGIYTPGDATPVEYARAVADLLQDPERLARLQNGAELSGRELTIEDMAERFADGIVQALLDVD